MTPQMKTRNVSAKIIGTITRLIRPMIPVELLPTYWANVVPCILSSNRECLHGRLDAIGDHLRAKQDKRANDCPKERLLRLCNLARLASRGDEKVADIHHHQNDDDGADADHNRQNAIQK